jgi:hypothetical protein
MRILFIPFIVLASFTAIAQEAANRMSLNGTAEFEQTENAFPPDQFSRTISVPGLIDLAMPEIEQHEAYFHGLHEPKYSWYRFKFTPDSKNTGQFAVLKMLKSRYNTQIILNGKDCGTYMQCNTPIDCDLTPFIQYGEENELLLRIGERAWLPKEAATGFDREKYTDIPGIWDDVFIDFSGPIKVHRLLPLPSLKNSNIIAKIRLENYSTHLERNMEYAEIFYGIKAFVREKNSGNVVSEIVELDSVIGCQHAQEIPVEIQINHPHAWTTDDPFLYELVVEVSPGEVHYKDYGNGVLPQSTPDWPWLGQKDISTATFGMRDFEAQGKDFYLNGERINLFGSTLTLNRFFEDPDRKHLPWDKEWVENLMITIPKAMGWNFFRVSIGSLPDFWYDLADEHGIMIQNEYLMWNLRGRPSQYEKEYTDWIWSDGNHPSIIIWDALNEQKQDYIGRVLIPKLKKVDPTRIWDLGYMKSEDIGQLEMNEIHWYPLAHGWWVTDDWYAEHIPAFRFGEVTKRYDGMDAFYEANTPIIVNEYGWLWQNRDGTKSGVRTYGEFAEDDITPRTIDYEYYELDGSQLYGDRDIYDHFLGKEASAEDRYSFQAYMLAIETEIIRSTREADGLASFAYLSNNNGYTGDWFKGDIEYLVPSETLLAHHACMRPFAVFVDVQDGRYLKNPDHLEPGQEFNLSLLALNDAQIGKSGSVSVQFINSKGKVVREEVLQVVVGSNMQEKLTASIKLPKQKGGYMILTQLTEDGSDEIVQVSRRYIRIGEADDFEFVSYSYEMPKHWGN